MSIPVKPTPAPPMPSSIIKKIDNLEAITNEIRNLTDDVKNNVFEAKVLAKNFESEKDKIENYIKSQLCSYDSTILFDKKKDYNRKKITIEKRLQ